MLKLAVSWSRDNISGRRSLIPLDPLPLKASDPGAAGSGQASLRYALWRGHNVPKNALCGYSLVGEILGGADGQKTVVARREQLLNERTSLTRTLIPSPFTVASQLYVPPRLQYTVPTFYYRRLYYRVYGPP